MTKIQELEQELKELKLAKRQLLLAGKKTDTINNNIKEIEKEIKSLKVEVNMQ